MSTILALPVDTNYTYSLPTQNPSLQCPLPPSNIPPHNAPDTILHHLWNHIEKTLHQNASNHVSCRWHRATTLDAEKLQCSLCLPVLRICQPSIMTSTTSSAPKNTATRPCDGIDHERHTSVHVTFPVLTDRFQVRLAPPCLLKHVLVLDPTLVQRWNVDWPLTCRRSTGHSWKR